MDASNYVSSPSSSLTYSSDSVRPEAGEEPFTVTSTPVPDVVTSSFASQNPGYEYAIRPRYDGTAHVSETSMDDIQHFFKRPIVIDTSFWNVGGFAYYRSLNPWQLYLTQPRVANRISNYRNVRGTMHIRFLLNGNQFYFGQAIAHAVPNFTADQLTRTRALIPQDLVAASQNPHVYLDPNLSQGGDLVLPFIYPFNAFNVVTNNQLESWLLVIRAFGPLQNAVGNTEAITITVMAWIEDITYSGLTDHNISGILPQSGEEDEYGKSSVSDMATALAKASGKLTNTPVIGPYARASEQVSSMVADVARAFGFSRPASTEPTTNVSQLFMGNMANANVSDGVQKLTMDVKQETTIDPATVCASSTDDMDLRALAMRESYVATYLWDNTMPFGTLILNARVCPSMYVDGPGAIPEKHMTPSAWVCVPFTYWRGSMKFRFKVLASSFHRGRIRITYDPVYALTGAPFNTVYNRVIDIGDTKDFTVKIGWASNKSYLECGTLTEDMHSAIPITPTNLIENGTIRLEVLTELTVPDSTVIQPVQILMFTSMCEDFEVFGPRGLILATTTINDPNGSEALAAIADSDEGMKPESGTMQMDENTDEPSKPTKPTYDGTLAAELIPTSDRSLDVYSGEAITSWRQCLKRYCFHNASKAYLGSGSSSIAIIGRMNRPDFPLYRGFQTDGVHATAAAQPYNYVRPTILNWVTPAYVGWRGGIRWKYHVMTNNLSNINGCTLTVNRIPFNPGWNQSETSFATSNTSSVIARAFTAAYPTMWQGGSVTNTTTNPGINVEVPYQFNGRYFNARRKDMATPNTGFRAHEAVYISSTQGPVLGAYCAAADDFTCFFFVSVPIVWLQTGDPAA